MDIPLKTIYEWEIAGLRSPSRTIACLDELLLDGDILVVFSYDPAPEAIPFLEKHSIDLGDEMDRFRLVISVNIEEYPNARFFALPVNLAVLQGLAGYVDDCGYDYDIFIDHLIAFRLGRPLLPLFFHDKLRHGYPMILSGHYEEAIVRAFCERVGASFVWKDKCGDIKK